MKRRFPRIHWRARCFAAKLRSAEFNEPAFTFTDAAMDTIIAAKIGLFELLDRHRAGDRGVLAEHVEQSDADTERQLSVFVCTNADGHVQRVVVCTDAARALTTFMLEPEFEANRSLYP